MRTPLTLVGVRMARADFGSRAAWSLMLALVVGIAALTAVSSYTERVQRGLELAAGELLAADLVVRSRQPIPQRIVDTAVANNLQTSPMTLFPSVLFGPNGSQLAEVKAVADDYPLRGRLEIATTRFAATGIAASAPAPGTAYADDRLLDALGLELGDQINVGALSLELSHIIVAEPDRGNSVAAIAPRVMIAQPDVAATELLAPGARAVHQWLLRGDPADVVNFQAEVDLPNNVAVITPADSQRQISAAIERSGRFLSLAALTAVLMAAVAIAISARQFATERVDLIALMRTFGSARATAFRVVMIELLTLALPAILLGIAIGYAAQGLLASILAGLLEARLPLPGPRAAFEGLGVGLLVLAAFALPPLQSLNRVTPMRVLRRDLPLPPVNALLTAGLALAAVVALIGWRTGDLALTFRIVTGALGAITVAVIIGRLALWLLAKLPGLRRGAVRLGLANLARRPTLGVIQLVGLSLGIMALSLLTLVRGELMEAWRADIPQDAPNFFFVNIQPEQAANFARDLQAQLAIDEAVSTFPMASGRLIAINGEQASREDTQDDDRDMPGGVNLTWANELPPANTLLEGQWFRDDGVTELSVESGYAERLGLGVGDELTFAVGDTEITASVANLREAAWDSFEVNFFLLAEPTPAIQALAHTRISSQHVAVERRSALPALIRDYPNITAIDVDAILNKVREIIDRVSQALELVFGFTLAAGLVVLLAAIGATEADRRQESVLLRTIGARSAFLRRANVAEFAFLCLLAGTIGAGCAGLLGIVVAGALFDIAYVPGFGLLLFVGLAVIGLPLVGLFGLRRVIATPPIRLLRRA